jgi:hypothetical protein
VLVKGISSVYCLLVKTPKFLAVSIFILLMFREAETHKKPPSFTPIELVLFSKNFAKICMDTKRAVAKNQPLGLIRQTEIYRKNGIPA